MREKSQTLQDYLKAGAASGLVNFGVKCAPDLYFTDMMNKSVNQISTKNSWQTIRGAVYWNFFYRMTMGLITFPLQRTLENKLIHYTEANTLQKKALIGSFTGWCAAMFEVLYAHPIDSMCVNVKNTPALFDNKFGVHYFRHNQSLLRKGMFAAALRNTCSNPPAWCAKTATQDYLSENTALNAQLKNLMVAMVFAMTRFLAGYPLDIIKIAQQCDNKQLPVKQLLQNQFKKEGVRFLTKGLSWRLPVNLASTAAQLYVFEAIAPRAK